MSDDTPYYEQMFGIVLDDWNWTYGSGVFTATHYMLVKEYFSEGCMSQDSTSLATGTNVITFIYPHWIKKQYYIEGVVEGQLTLTCDGDDSVLTSYTVRLMKIDDEGVITQIGTTGIVIPTNVNFTWDAGTSTGTEIVYPFFMTVSPEQEVLDKERLYVEITIVVADDNLILYHTNDSTWEDMKISIPLRGL